MPRRRFSWLHSIGRRRHGEIKEDYWIMFMSILKLGYGKDCTVPRYGRLDTGSEINLVAERILEELGYEYYHNTDMSICTLGRRNVQPVGDITLKWHIEGRPDRVFSTDFLVIAKDIPVSFDFLLGRHCITETKALLRNREVLCLDKRRVARMNYRAKTDLNLVSTMPLL
jgi:hypothetical protein